ncbi:Ubiquitin-protein ligase E3C, partial [Pseudolycoriella hygida]
FLSQFLIKNPNLLLANAITDSLWLYRTKKLLFLCTQQICVQSLPPSIPFRMLEIFTSEDQLSKNLSDEAVVRRFLEDTYAYLIKLNYFPLVRQMINEKVPPLYEPVVSPPNALSDTLLRMIIQPLKLIHSLNGFSKVVILSFIEAFMSSEFSDPVKFFVIPALASNPTFPFIFLVKYLAEAIENVDMDDVPASSATKQGRTSLTSSYLLNALLKLDELHHSELNNVENLTLYIKIIASMSSNINRLPRRTGPAVLREDESSDSDSDDSAQSMRTISVQEADILLDVVAMLNDENRSRLIIGNIEEYFLNEPPMLHCICKVAHHIMMYNQIGAFDDRFLTLLTFKPKFIRKLWYMLTSQSSQLGFSSPLNLLAKAIHIPQKDIDSVIPILATFCTIFGRLISTLHDGEFCQDVLPGTVSKIMPFTLSEIVPVSSMLKDISLGLVDLAFPETRSTFYESYGAFLKLRSSQDEDQFNKTMWPHLLKVCVSLLRQLHTRDLRRGFCPENHWTVQTLNLPLDKDLHLSRRRNGPRPFQPIKDFTKEDFESGGPPLSTKQIRSITILREIPFVVPFNSRVGILQGLLSADKL